jgi:hypothetical protein
VAGYSNAIGWANNILVVWGTALVLATLLLIRAGTSMPSALRYSLCTFLLVAIANNLGFRIAGHDPEPLRDFARQFDFLLNQ